MAVNAAEADRGDLIPRRALFGNPDRTGLALSPDGTRLSFLAPLDGVQNVWVGPVGDPASARPVTRDARRGIRNYRRAYGNEHILYLQDRDGDENWRLYAADAAGGAARAAGP